MGSREKGLVLLLCLSVHWSILFVDLVIGNISFLFFFLTLYYHLFSILNDDIITNLSMLILFSSSYFTSLKHLFRSSYQIVHAIVYSVV